ncbi:MAG: HD domain-containing protein [Planctomycetia bacterium]|nr:HD domain-containing protein [Planctomycetia bacterium]
MPTKNLPIVALAELEVGQDADVFALLFLKEEQRTKDGKPYYRVGFRDAGREVVFPVWNDAPLGEDCRRAWKAGTFYKLRCSYKETSFGPQLDIRKIREVVDADSADGFDPNDFRPRSKFAAETMFGELRAIASEKIGDEPLRLLTLHLLDEHHDALLTLPAATRNHHSFSGGFLEHVLSMTRSAIFFAEKYAAYYDDMTPPLDVDLVVAGAILHDIGKLRELEWQPEGPAYTAEGNLIGHVLQGRDMVREAAAMLAAQEKPVERERLLRLEHIVVSHQRLPEWGAPKPPMTPEALLVHYADDLDAKYHMLYVALRDDKTPGHTTSKKNVLTQQFYRGPQT